MGLLDFFINVNDAFDSFRNFSCSSQNLDGFLRCYRHARGNECYGDSTNIQVATSGHGTGRIGSYNTNKAIERGCWHLTLSEAIKFSFARKVCIGKGRLELTRREAIKLLFTRKVWHEKDVSGQEFLAIERYDLPSLNERMHYNKACYGDSTNAIMASRSGCKKSCSPPTMQRTLGPKEYCSECGAELYELFHDPNNNRICPECGNKEYYWDVNL